MDALRQCRLISRRESDFLNAANASSHLDWGLLHLCRTIEDRRVQVLGKLARFSQLMATVLMGLLVMFIVVAMFLPLIKLINDLAVEPTL